MKVWDLTSFALLQTIQNTDGAERICAICFNDEEARLFTCSRASRSSPCSH